MSDFKSLLDAISGALRVIAKADDIPGLSLIPYLDTIAKSAEVIGRAIELGQNVKANIDAIRDTFGEDKKLPTPEEMQALDQRIAVLEERIMAPIPSKEEGEP